MHSSAKMLHRTINPTSTRAAFRTPNGSIPIHLARPTSFANCLNADTCVPASSSDASQKLNTSADLGRRQAAAGLAAISMAQALAAFAPASWADEVVEVAGDASPDAAATVDVASPLPAAAPPKGDKVFFELQLEGQPAGRIVIQLYDSPKVGSARFRDLCVGKAGVGYRRSRIDGIFEDYLRGEGQLSLSYSATAASLVAGGDSIDDLEKELKEQTRKHDRAGLVSLIVLEDEGARPITEKLIARDGKLVTIQQQAGEAPNGTSFMITRGAAPDLDRPNLIVGEVVEGMDVVEFIGKQPFSRPREDWYDGPFFAVGKAMGDKRAVTAEKGFNRPLKRIVISKSGIVA